MSSSEKSPNVYEKLGYSVLAGVIFAVISSPPVYKLVDKFFALVFRRSGIVASPGGCPNYLGLLVHTLVFILVVFLIMQPWKK